MLRPNLFSRYVFVNYMTKNGLFGQIVKAAKDIFVLSRNDTWNVDHKEQEDEQPESVDRGHNR